MLAVEPRFERVQHVLSGAVGTRFTGAVARIEQRGRLRFERAYGTTRVDDLGRPVYVDTLFDLASLTKLFVATLALAAVAQRRLALDEPLTAWFWEWKNTDRARITLRMLLAHTSGMNSGADYRELLGHNVVQYALEQDLAANPGARVIYSDLGFIALGELLERRYGRSLRALMRSLDSAPQYLPASAVRPSIPATEDDGWRGRVQGIVHDEKAHLMGGVAGHAGLFGTAKDVARLAERYLAPLCERAPGQIPVDLVHAAVKEQGADPILRRGLGWALKTSDENSCGARFSMESFGHTGFVGTCVWADPRRDCSGVLLTNSVYFGRSDTRELRAAFYEALVEDLAE